MSSISWMNAFLIGAFSLQSAPQAPAPCAQAGSCASTCTAATPQAAQCATGGAAMAPHSAAAHAGQVAHTAPLGALSRTPSPSRAAMAPMAPMAPRTATSAHSMFAPLPALTPQGDPSCHPKRAKAKRGAPQPAQTIRPGVGMLSTPNGAALALAAPGQGCTVVEGQGSGCTATCTDGQAGFGFSYSAPSPSVATATSGTTVLQGGRVVTLNPSPNGLVATTNLTYQDATPAAVQPFAWGVQSGQDSTEALERRIAELERRLGIQHGDADDSDEADEGSAIVVDWGSDEADEPAEADEPEEADEPDEPDEPEEADAFFSGMGMNEEVVPEWQAFEAPDDQVTWGDGEQFFFNGNGNGDAQGYGLATVTEDDGDGPDADDESDDGDDDADDGDSNVQVIQLDDLSHLGWSQEQIERIRPQIERAARAMKEQGPRIQAEVREQLQRAREQVREAQVQGQRALTESLGQWKRQAAQARREAEGARREAEIVQREAQREAQRDLARARESMRNDLARTATQLDRESKRKALTEKRLMADKAPDGQIGDGPFLRRDQAADAMGELTQLIREMSDEVRGLREELRSLREDVRRSPRGQAR